MKTELYDGIRKVKVNTRQDIRLFSAPRPASPSPEIQWWGRDLYMHVNNQKNLYYIHLWSTDRTADEKAIPLSPIMAEHFMRQRGINCEMFLPRDPVANLYRWGYGIAEEF